MTLWKIFLLAHFFECENGVNTIFLLFWGKNIRAYKLKKKIQYKIKRSSNSQVFIRIHVSARSSFSNEKSALAKNTVDLWICVDESFLFWHIHSNVSTPAREKRRIFSFKPASWLTYSRWNLNGVVNLIQLYFNFKQIFFSLDLSNKVTLMQKYLNL